MGHWVTAYWYGKNPAASLFGTGPSYGMSSQEVMGWMEYGGGRKLYEEAVASVGFDYIGFFHMPMPAQPFGCLLYTSPSPRDKRQSRMPSSA